MAITTTRTAKQNVTLADGDASEEFEATFDVHWPWVCAVLRRLTGDRDEAEDLALEVFYRLYRHPPNDQARLKGWLYRVATNVGLNALRARRRRRRYEDAAARLRVERTSVTDPASEVERSETQRRVRRVLAQMKPRAAQLMILRHSGLSYAEIAESLNVAPGSVGTMLARAERAFERRYRALEESDGTP